MPLIPPRTATAAASTARADQTPRRGDRTSADPEVWRAPPSGSPDDSSSPGPTDADNAVAAWDGEGGRIAPLRRSPGERR